MVVQGTLPYLSATFPSRADSGMRRREQREIPLPQGVLRERYGGRGEGKMSQEKEDFWETKKETTFFPFTKLVPHIEFDESKWEIKQQTLHFVEIKAKTKYMRFVIAPNKEDFMVLLEEMRRQSYRLVYEHYSVDRNGTLVFEKEPVMGTKKGCQCGK